MYAIHFRCPKKYRLATELNQENVLDAPFYPWHERTKDTPRVEYINPRMDLHPLLSFAFAAHNPEIHSNSRKPQTVEIRSIPDSPEIDLHSEDYLRNHILTAGSDTNDNITMKYIGDMLGKMALSTLNNKIHNSRTIGPYHEGIREKEIVDPNYLKTMRAFIDNNAGRMLQKFYMDHPKTGDIYKDDNLRKQYNRWIVDNHDHPYIEDIAHLLTNTLPTPRVK